MIVDRHTAHRILVGEVTQHRLPRNLRPPRTGQVLPVRRVVDLAGYVVVTSCHLSRDRTHPSEPLVGHDATLDAESIAALGHDSLASYVRAWLLDRDQAWLARRGPEDAPTTYTGAIAALEQLPDARVFDRWKERWADLSVWVIEWRPEQDDRPRLLAQPGRLRFRSEPNGHQVIDDTDDPDADHGYTTRRDRALPQEPEAIDFDALRPRWGREAAVRHAAATPAEERARGLAKRLRAA